MDKSADLLSHGDMIRTTSNNLSEMLLKVADHIDYLENKVKELKAKLNES